jgi:hypothetical protein
MVMAIFSLYATFISRNIPEKNTALSKMLGFTCVRIGDRGMEEMWR